MDVSSRDKNVSVHGVLTFIALIAPVRKDVGGAVCRIGPSSSTAVSAGLNASNFPFKVMRWESSEKGVI